MAKEANTIEGCIVPGVIRKALLKMTGKVSEVSVALVLAVLGCQMRTKRNHKILQLHHLCSVALDCCHQLALTSL